MRGTLFCGVNLIGDALCTTPAVREWRLAHPDDYVLYVAQDQPISRILLKNPSVDRVRFDEGAKVRSMRGYGNFTKRHLFDVSKAWDYGIPRRIHMAQAYGVLAGIGVGSCRPVLRLVDAERAEAAPHIPSGRFVVVCPHSVSSTVETADRGGNKLWGDSKWIELFPILHEMGFAIVSLGGPQDPKFYPDDDSAVTEIHNLPIRVAAAVMERADYVVTLDSGLAHIAAALDKNVVEIYPRLLPIEWVRPHTTHNRVIQGYPPQIKVRAVAAALDELVGEVEGKKGKKKAEKEEPVPAPFNAAEDDTPDDGERAPEHNEETDAGLAEWGKGKTQGDEANE